MTGLLDRAAPRRHRLGAEELLELGRARDRAETPVHRPFLADRMRRPALRQVPRAPETVHILDILGDVAGFIVHGLSIALDGLGTLLDLPLGILSQGVDVVFNGLSGLFSGIPVIGDVMAQILVLGGSIIKFGLSVPGLLLHGLGNILAGVAKFLKGENSEAENGEKVEGAKKSILDQTPSNLKDNVKRILDASGVTGGDLTPSVKDDGTPAPTPVEDLEDRRVPGAPAPGGTSDLTTALAIGVPAVGVLALVAALA